MTTQTQPTLASLRRHEVPAWYHDAKLGIFIHWSLFSVPAWAPLSGSIHQVLRDHYDRAVELSPYADWYENALRFPESPTGRHHAEHHLGLRYEDFREPFLRGLESWDPDAWADRFARAGARYVVLVTKHHDGFCLWPSEVPNPHRKDWNTGRDVVGELAAAVRRRGLRFGTYYSGGLDWSFEPRPLRTLGDMFTSIPVRGAYPDYAEAQVRELIERYRPDVLWNDIAWPTDRSRLFRLLADYYDAVPEGVVNDRWVTPGWTVSLFGRWPFKELLDAAMARSIRRRGPGAAPSSPHCDFRTPEYVSFDRIRQKKWESTRGMGHSFAYKRNEPAEDLISEVELVQGLADIVAKNGNLLLNVGPRGEDAAIPAAQLERLEALGTWLARDGEAIHGTRPWRRAEGETREGLPVRFTAHPGADRLYAILLGTPAGSSLTLRDLRAAPGSRARVVGGGAARWRQDGPDLVVELADPLAPGHAHALAIEPCPA